MSRSANAMCKWQLLPLVLTKLATWKRPESVPFPLQGIVKLIQASLHASFSPFPFTNAVVFVGDETFPLA